LSLLRLKLAPFAGQNMPAARLPACDASHNVRTIQNDSELFRLSPQLPKPRVVVD
jgi:hypothetical protein